MFPAGVSFKRKLKNVNQCYLLNIYCAYISSSVEERYLSQRFENIRKKSNNKNDQMDIFDYVLGCERKGLVGFRNYSLLFAVILHAIGIDNFSDILKFGRVYDSIQKKNSFAL